MFDDVRFAVRTIFRSPSFAATAILTLALGIGGSTSIFSVVYAVALRPLAFPLSERAVVVGWAKAGTDPSNVWPLSFPDLQAIKEKCTAFELIGATRHDGLTSEKGNLRVPVPGSEAGGGAGQAFTVPQMASADVFKILGASTVLGRLPDARDEQPGATPVAVISYSAWTSLYGRDPGVLGQTITRHLDNRQTKSLTIVGVLAPGAFAIPGRSSDAVAAWGSFDEDVARARTDQGQYLSNLSVQARLAPGKTVEVARAELAALASHLTAGLPEHLAKEGATLQVYRLRDLVAARVRTPLMAFLAAVICLLLLASVNAASLVLARSMSRQQEFATRFALGARPSRVVRQLLTESALLATAGGALGLLLAWAGVRGFVAVSPAMPRLGESGIDAATLGFAAAAVALATCVAGVLPAWQASRRSVFDGLRGGGPLTGSTSLSRPLATLAAAEIALVLVVLTGTGLLVNSFARLVVFDLGFDPRAVVTMTIEHVKPDVAPATRPPQDTTPRRIVAFSDPQRLQRMTDEEVISRVLAIPGVAAAGLTGDDPFGPPYRYGADIRIGAAGTPASPALRISSPAAFDAFGMRMVAGRWFGTTDTDGAPLVAVVNETMARTFWSGRSPVGDAIVMGRRALQVAGVVTDVRERGARGEVRPTFYVSSAQIPPDPAMLVVRTAPGVSGIERAIATELDQMRGRINPYGPRRLEEIWWRQLTDTRFLTLVLTVFSAVALLVALVGVHGVLRFVVARRTREMGVRKALGATNTDLVILVIRQALRFALPGCIVGLIAGAAAGPALRSLLFGITPGDPLTLIAATLLLLAAVVVGAYFPARRAGAVDPALSLRAE